MGAQLALPGRRCTCGPQPGDASTEADGGQPVLGGQPVRGGQPTLGGQPALGALVRSYPA